MSTSDLGMMQSGDIATITGVNAEAGLKQRLNALGFRSGQQVQIIRKAWFKGPLHVRIGTTEVMLRRQEALNIAVMNIKSGEML